MDEVIPNLWLGDINSAVNVDNLRDHNIRSVLTAMRGRISIHETLMHHQVNLDDTEDTDVLTHLLAAIAFIQSELDKGHGVLVHCHAGISRSATIVAAYVMYTQHLDPNGALELIRKARPNAEPNSGFLEQLEIFHKASFQVSRQDKAVRMFYLERVMNEILNGEGGVETDMFAKFPHTPSDSTPNTPGGPRRRIRCKMCRQELATREHMLDHGQLGPATPAFSPAVSRHPSMHTTRPNGFSPMTPAQPSRRPSMHDSNHVLTSMSPSSSRRTSMHESLIRARLGSNADNRPLRPSLLTMDATQTGQNIADSFPLSESAFEGDSDEEIGNDDSSSTPPENTSVSAIQSSQNISSPTVTTSPVARQVSSGGFIHPSDLAAQLYANPKLAALRSPTSLGTTPPMTPTSSTGLSKATQFSPPILMNPKCSGYFVEPMKWMEIFLEQGEMAGKIICPNKKCGAKLGHYDWAGVCCGCKEWVVPGFCINRSKVDEIV